MKLVYLYHSLAIWGGVERIFVDKMNYLVHHYGYEVYMITSDQGQHKIPYDLDERAHFIDLNIRFHRRYQYKWWRRPFIYRQMSQIYHKLLQEHLDVIRPDVIVCTSIQDVRPLLKVKGGIPLIVESHINFLRPDTLFHRMQTWINNYWIGKADALVTLTDGDAENWKRISKNVLVIPNIVQMNPLPQYSSGKEKRVIFVGRFAEQKGIGELFAIWKSIYPKFADWHLDLYGEGELWDQYQQEAEALNMNIELHQPTKDIFEAYCNSSIFVLTSLYEPFGLVIPEAMSCGLPVVSYASPYGPASIISDGKDGFIVPLHDRQAFADRLCQLMANEELRKEMGQCAIASSHRFSADKIMPMWKELFEKLTSLS